MNNPMKNRTESLKEAGSVSSHREGSGLALIALNFTDSNILQPGDIRITYHPHSKRDPAVIGPEEFKKGINDAASAELPDEEPWLPFRSREDFEFAEIVHDAAMNQSQIDNLIKLIHRCQENPGAFTLKSCRDLRNLWEDARALLTDVSGPRFQYTKLLVLKRCFSSRVTRSNYRTRVSNTLLKPGHGLCGSGF